MASRRSRQQLRHRFSERRAGTRGHPSASLRDGEIGGVEAGLALLADVDPARARELLHAADRRGLAALCARADFGAPHYVALRMALDLAEQGFEGADPRWPIRPRPSRSSKSSTI